MATEYFRKGRQLVDAHESQARGERGASERRIPHTLASILAASGRQETILLTWCMPGLVTYPAVDAYAYVGVHYIISVASNYLRRYNLPLYLDLQIPINDSHVEAHNDLKGVVAEETLRLKGVIIPESSLSTEKAGTVGHPASAWLKRGDHERVLAPLQDLVADVVDPLPLEMDLARHIKQAGLRPVLDVAHRHLGLDVHKQRYQRGCRAHDEFSPAESLAEWKLMCLLVLEEFRGRLKVSPDEQRVGCDLTQAVVAFDNCSAKG
ncbi:hypothetical protein F5B17DRAFT_435083 [Nemania serpens]|nr:hypothetical protein F5B17DRAFT_435083 [Nemania serpens]